MIEVLNHISMWDFVRTIFWIALCGSPLVLVCAWMNDLHTYGSSDHAPIVAAICIQGALILSFYSGVIK